MKVSTTLENIEYTLQQKNKYYINDKKKRAIKKEYQEILKSEIESTIELYFEKSENIKETYQDLLIHSKNIINDLIKEIKELQQQQFEEITTYKLNGEQYQETSQKVYFWDDFTIEKDIESEYFNILKSIYKQYEEIEKVKNERIIELLKNDIAYIYNNYSYNIANKTIMQDLTHDDFIEHYKLKGEQAETIKNNYFKIAKKIDSEYKEREKGAKKENNKNIIERNKGKIYLGSALLGIASGLKKAIK